jgi:hypothetical protein
VDGEQLGCTDIQSSSSMTNGATNNPRSLTSPAALSFSDHSKELSMKIVKYCASGFLSIASLAVLTMAGCAIDPAPDPDHDEVSDIQDQEGEPVESVSSALSCSGVGAIQTMASDPDTGAIDVGSYCLGEINKYRATKNLVPYTLRPRTAANICCEDKEAKSAAQIGDHANGGCGWQAQGFCAGGRNPDGTAKKSTWWCPKLFFNEGPAGGHYQAMMRPATRQISCSFYAVSRDKHSVVVDYY